MYELPIIEKAQTHNYKISIEEYEQKHGKPLKPINRRKNSTDVSKNVICPKCGAPHDYIYDNSGGCSGFKFKICTKS